MFGTHPPRWHLAATPTPTQSACCSRTHLPPSGLFQPCPPAGPLTRVCMYLRTRVRTHVILAQAVCACDHARTCFMGVVRTYSEAHSVTRYPVICFVLCHGCSRTHHPPAGILHPRPLPGLRLMKVCTYVRNPAQVCTCILQGCPKWPFGLFLWGWNQVPTQHHHPHITTASQRGLGPARAPLSIASAPFITSPTASHPNPWPSSLSPPDTSTMADTSIILAMPAPARTSRVYILAAPTPVWCWCSED